MSDPVVTKYYACTQFDAQGQCTATVWVDPPSVLPPLSVGAGNAIGAAMFLVILGVFCLRRFFR